jgi:hypothetical protein
VERGAWRGGWAMPVKVIGMIGVTPAAGDATVHVIEGGV